MTQRILIIWIFIIGVAMDCNSFATVHIESTWEFDGAANGYRMYAGTSSGNIDYTHILCETMNKDAKKCDFYVDDENARFYVVRAFVIDPNNGWITEGPSSEEYPYTPEPDAPVVMEVQVFEDQIVPASGIIIETSLE
jgi:hypothetical protein